MKTILLFFLSLSIPMLSMAQEEEFHRILLSEEHTAARITSATAPNRLYEFAMEYPEIQGQPYLEENWQKGTLHLSDGSSLTDITFRYNIYEDLVEVMYQGRRINLEPTEVTGFSFLDGQTGAVRNFRNGFKVNTVKASRDKEITSASYMEVLYESDHTLVLRHWYKAVQKSDNTTNVPGLGQGAAVSYHFTQAKEEAFIIKEGLFLPVKLSKKGFLEAFLDERPLIQKYIKDKWLRCKTTEELAQVAKYYDKIRLRRAQRKAEREREQEQRQ